MTRGHLFKAAIVALVLGPVAGCGKADPSVEAVARDRQSTGATASRPNIVFLLTDDQHAASFQEVAPDGVKILKNIDELMMKRGTTFSSNFISYSLCCPSRTTFLTGQYAHNHLVMSNSYPLGGFKKFIEASNPTDTLPVWLQKAGYRTGHIGKYLNGYGNEDTALPGAACKEIPPGWDEWYGAIDPYNYMYYDYIINEGGRLVVYGTPPASPPSPTSECALEPGPRVYRTDHDAQVAVDFIQRNASAAQPFFLSVAFLAVHEDKGLPPGPEPAPEDKGTLAGLALPRPPSFNEEDMSDKPAFMRLLPSMTALEIYDAKTVYQRRMEALKAVDRAVQRILAALEATGQLDNTLVVFTSDNGYFHGEHRLPAGKGLAYEEAVRFPLILRGPGVPENQVSEKLVANVDVAPTLAELAQASSYVSRTMDGRSLLPLLANPASAWRTSLLLEAGNLENVADFNDPTSLEERVATLSLPTSYSAIRTHRFSFVEYSNGEREYYDLWADPYQLTSKHNSDSLLDKLTMAALKQQLETLKTCSGGSCWK